MKYKEFKEKLGKFTIPKGDLAEALICGIDSIHFVARLAEIKDGEYNVVISEELMGRFVDTVEMLEKRGAVREADYIVAGNAYPDHLTVEIHTTDKFFSPEDAPAGIKVINTK